MHIHLSEKQRLYFISAAKHEEVIKHIVWQVTVLGHQANRFCFCRERELLQNIAHTPHKDVICIYILVTLKVHMPREEVILMPCPFCVVNPGKATVESKIQINSNDLHSWLKGHYLSRYTVEQ